jgi:hypothetical protein
MENANNTRATALDLQVIDVNLAAMQYSKRLELLSRWIPICQEIADECGVELPDADRLRLMILSAYRAMCLLANSALAFPDPIIQDRIVTQFLIDCFTVGSER